MNKSQAIKARAIRDQSYKRRGATIFTMDTPISAAFSVEGSLFVMANSKLPRAERTKEIRDLIDRYRACERTEVLNA